MTKRNRKKDRYASPADYSTEKRITNTSAILIEPKLEEYSEISADAMGADYGAACLGASLIPVQNGWGLFHCTVLDKRKRRARATLATQDPTYHRAFVAAASYPDRGVELDIALARYPYMRRGWPGPSRQGGSWINGESIPWRSTYRDAAPQPGMEVGHLHGVQATLSGAMREVYAALCVSPRGSHWTILDDEPVREISKLVFPDSGVEVYFPAGVAVMPGWVLPSAPNKCDSCT
ncbi:MAG TPA: hypothetical protein VES42_22715 [Pilimelia sp.]|nr:hypothetical protein [Pilimelia sp.]